MRTHGFVSIAIAIVASATIAHEVRAQTGGAYDLSWNTIDPGGSNTATGGVYSLGGTAGQIDAGAHSGGAYVLSGGFWSGIDARTDVPPVTDGSAAPSAIVLHPAAPNPFGRETTLAFDLPRAGHASARIFSASGELVRTLVDGSMPAGRHNVVWPGTNDSGRRVAQGIYVARLESGADVATRKLVLTR
ncbi:MAG: FlgD immunoglobulin-like domain containing protein [bacterium]